MRIRSAVVLMMSFLGAAASAQTPNGDLRMVKTYQSSGQAFVMTVTNFGPNTVPGPITVTDTLPPPAQFINPVPPPWSCTPALPSGSVTCTAPGPLAPGNSIQLKLRVSLAGVRSNLVNCASVTARFTDPNPDNNRDCACVDVNPCRDVTIDITTGRENGANLAAGAQDQEWRYMPSNAGSFVASGPWGIPAGATAGRWINPNAVGSTGLAPSVAAGTYLFEFPFTLGDEWGTNGCRLRFRFAADNSVTFSLDGGPSIGATPSAVSTTTGAFTTLHPASTIVVPVGAGSHVLRATVTNGSPQHDGPTGLFVQGDVFCPCKGFGDDPIDGTNTSTAATR